MRVLVLGRGEGLLASAQALVSDGRHKVVAVITARPNAEYAVGQAEFEDFARSQKAAFRETQKIDAEVQDLVRDAHADVGISVNWVTILDNTTLGLVSRGVLNAHLGDLPRYRGNAAGNWAILAGEPYAVLTVHRMTPSEVDVGQILSQRRIDIGPSTSIMDLVTNANASLPSMFQEALDRLEMPSGDNPEQPAAREGFRTYPRLPGDGLIDWGQSAAAIDRLVRATTRPYPGAYTYFRDNDERLRKLIVWEAGVVDDIAPGRGVPGQVISNNVESGESHILTGEGVLALRLVSQSGEVDAYRPGTRWRSTRLRLGMRVEDELFRLLGTEDEGGETFSS